MPFDIDARNSEQNLEIAKKINKPFWNGYPEQYIVVSSAPGNPNNLQPITLDGQRVPFWNGNTFFNSQIFVSSDSSKIGIGVSPSTEKLEVNGNVKAISYIFTIDASAGTSGKMQYDGDFYYGTNSTGVKKKIAYDEQIYKTIAGNTTIDNSYHNAIVFVTANCIITVDATLRNDFNCCFVVIGSFTATFTEGISATFYSPFGKILRVGRMCILIKRTSTQFLLNGNLATV